MLTRRIIVCLDMQGGRVVKGTRFIDLRDVGDPVELAERYEAEGADELCFRSRHLGWRSYFCSRVSERGAGDTRDANPCDGRRG